MGNFWAGIKERRVEIGRLKQTIFEQDEEIKRLQGRVQIEQDRANQEYQESVSYRDWLQESQKKVRKLEREAEDLKEHISEQRDLLWTAEQELSELKGKTIVNGLDDYRLRIISGDKEILEVGTDVVIKGVYRGVIHVLAKGDYGDSVFGRVVDDSIEPNKPGIIGVPW